MCNIFSKLWTTMVMFIYNWWYSYHELKWIVLHLRVMVFLSVPLNRPLLSIWSVMHGFVTLLWWTIIGKPWVGCSEQFNRVFILFCTKTRAYTGSLNVFFMNSLSKSRLELCLRVYMKNFCKKTSVLYPTLF